MRTLKKQEIIELVEKAIRHLYPNTLVKDMRILPPSFNYLEYDPSLKRYHLDALKESLVIMAFFNGYHDTPITIQQIKYYIKKEFKDAKNILIEMIVNTDDKRMVWTDELVDQLVDFHIEIYYDHETRLSAEEADILIDIALQMNDKEWFTELTNKYKKSPKEA